MPEVRCPACGTLNRVPEARAGTPARCGKCRGPIATASGPVAVTDETFERVVLNATAPVVLDCWAEWCGPCHMLAPTINELAGSYAGRAIVAKLDVEANPSVAARFDVRGIPALLFFSNGRLVDRLVGVQPRAAIEARLTPLLAART